MTGYARAMNRYVRMYDRELFVSSGPNGIPCVYRKAKRAQTFSFGDDYLTIVHDSPEHVIALTEDWTLRTPVREWGSILIEKKLGSIDLSKSDDVINDLLMQEEREEISQKRAMQNETEAFLLDNYSQFKKAYSDVNTSNMEKTDRRRIDEKQIKRR